MIVCHGDRDGCIISDHNTLIHRGDTEHAEKSSVSSPLGVLRASAVNFFPSARGRNHVAVCHGDRDGCIISDHNTLIHRGDTEYAEKGRVSSPLGVLRASAVNFFLIERGQAQVAVCDAHVLMPM